LNVYEPQELTEEQVWEEVETWVNSLLEEGYDLSEYTWEEMYESYLEEQG
jgi:thioester reductase-like protein